MKINTNVYLKMKLMLTNCSNVVDKIKGKMNENVWEILAKERKSRKNKRKNTKTHEVMNTTANGSNNN